MAILAALSLTAAPLAATLAAPSAAAAPQKKSYIVVMKADPLVRSMPAKSLDTSSARSRKGDLRRAQDRVVAAVGLPASAKTTSYTNALNGFAIRATEAQVDALAKRPEVAAVLVDELRQPTANEESRRSIDVRRGPGNQLYDFLGLDGRGESWSSGMNGAGVTVGVIDTGIWPEHPSFADDGTYPAHEPLDTSVGSACAFGNTTHNPHDAAYACNNKLVGARVFLDTYRANTGLTAEEFDSARDNEGHG